MTERQNDECELTKNVVIDEIKNWQKLAIALDFCDGAKLAIALDFCDGTTKQLQSNILFFF